MAAANFDIYVEQGATWRLSLVYGRKDGTLDSQGNPNVVPYDLTGCIARMQIRQRRGSEVLISTTTLNGGIVFDTDLTSGKMRISISDEATDSLTMRSAKYDLELEYPSGDVVRLLQGNVTISGNITQDADLDNISPGVTYPYELDEELVPGPD
jgi:hypothetical protein